MVFSHSIFLFIFLSGFLIVYFLLPARLKNIFALISSIAFYSWGAPDFIFIVLGSIVADFFIVEQMNKMHGSNKKMLLFLSLFINVGLLMYFKYYNFFLENIDAMFRSFGWGRVFWIKVALPIGISFFTFQKITYTVDVYRKVHKPLKYVWDYALYILMFPQLIAGPIVRFNEIADEIVDRKKNDVIDNKLTGFFRFSIGLAKKVFIANTLGREADVIFATDTALLDSSTAWIGILAYAFQIYFDFSGYSDMAIGLGRMMGFTFPENFNNPYVSQSISEFWRRWHMTLGRWMKDYLYIPLGGSKVSANRMYLNLWIVFLISGFWHGAAWNFIVWGAFHGFFLVADRLFLLKFYKAIGKYPSILITFFITLIGWVYFRAESVDHAHSYIGAMFSFKTQNILYLFNDRFFTFLILAFVFSFWAVIPGLESWQDRVYAIKQKSDKVILLGLAGVVLLLLSAAPIVSSGFNPFIYFRF